MFIYKKHRLRITTRTCDRLPSDLICIAACKYEFPNLKTIKYCAKRKRESCTFATSRLAGRSSTGPAAARSERHGTMAESQDCYGSSLEHFRTCSVSNVPCYCCVLSLWKIAYVFLFVLQQEDKAHGGQIISPPKSLKVVVL